MRAAQAGDSEAFAGLVRRHEGWVRNMLCARLGSRGDWEEAYQEAFVKAFASLGSLREPEAFRGWMRTLAERVAGDLKRGRRSLPLPDGEQGAIPEDSLDREERRSAVARAVESLEDGYRQVVEMRYDRGLSCGEIAKALGLTPATVSMRLLRAHQSLAKGLAPWREGA